MRSALPVDEMANALDYFVRFRFPRSEAWPITFEKACHAIAIDDERRTFAPVLWNEAGEKGDGRLEQVWFAGVHTNVGGGYPKEGMAMVTLEWMMVKAEAAGLIFDPESVIKVSREANVQGKHYNSRAGLASYYRYQPRDIGELCADKAVNIARPKNP